MKDYKFDQFIKIVNVLYPIDPANTSCLYNDALDEYDREANMIIDAFYASPQDFTYETVEAIFNESFENYFDEDLLKQAFTEIMQILQ